MFQTKSEQELIVVVNKLWAEHYKSPLDVRKQIVESFTEEWFHRANLTKPLMRHPSTRKKDYRCTRSALDILTDLILEVDQVHERNSEEYPIHNAEKELREEQRPTYAMVEDRDEDSPRKPFTIEESSMSGVDYVAEVIFAESTAKTVAELQALIAEVKESEDYYVNLYADDSHDWNNNIRTKKRTIVNVRKAIRELDVGRVRECLECGGAFYAHDLRRNVCDSQRYRNPRTGKLSKYSICEIKQKRKREKREEKSRKTA
ncbi:hypothetical protein [Sutcliffiella horikoshii]|uniref:hypothetical protein n=1 Tax=Sutcliffiella horikoshii TaxID=79883 RepID=UPI003CF4514C